MLIYFVKPWNGGWRKGKTTLPRFHRWQFITTLHATLRILSTFVNVRFARQNGQFGSFICQLPKYLLDIRSISKNLKFLTKEKLSKNSKSWQKIIENPWTNIEAGTVIRRWYLKSHLIHSRNWRRVALMLLHSQIRITNPFIMKRTLAFKKRAWSQKEYRMSMDRVTWSCFGKLRSF